MPEGSSKVRLADYDAMRTHAGNSDDRRRSIGPRHDCEPSHAKRDRRHDAAGHKLSPKPKKAPVMRELPITASRHLKPSG